MKEKLAVIIFRTETIFQELILKSKSQVMSFHPQLFFVILSDVKEKTENED